MALQMPNSYARTVLGGFATFLAEKGLADWDEFGTGTAYTAGTEWPIYPGPELPATPHRMIGLTMVSQSRQAANVTTVLQLRIRTMPNDGADVASSEDIDTALNKINEILAALYPNGFPLVHVTLGSIRAGRVDPGEVLEVDPDSNRRSGALMNVSIRSRQPRPSA